MPSTVVHVALAGLVGTTLLSDEFDARGILAVMAVVALLDLDTLIGAVVPGTHRAALHNVFVVLLPAAVLLWDRRLRDRSFVLERWGRRGFRIGWVSLAAVFVAHILLDAFFNGANLFWPVHDRFYDLSGELLVTDRRGVVQTFVEFDGGGVGDSTARGTTDDTHYSTGFDPTREDPPENVERIFPIAATGERFVIVLAGFGTVLYRVLEERRSN